MLVTVQGCKKNSHSQRQAQTVQDGRDTGWQVDTVVMELGARELGLQCYSVWEVCCGNGVSSLSDNTGQKMTKGILGDEDARRQCLGAATALGEDAMRH